MRLRPTVLLSVALAVAATGSAEGPEPLLRLQAGALESAPSVAFPRVWRFHTGEGPAGAAPTVDDSSWALQATLLSPGEAWTQPAVAWYRARLEVPPELAGRPLALRVFSMGAGELYVDGARVFGWGRIATDPREARLENPLSSHVLTLPPGPHLVAVRFANPLAEDFRRAGYYAGFSLSVGLAERALPADVDRAARGSGLTWLFTGVFLSFAVLHLLLYLFGPEVRENLHFALLCAANAFLAWALFFKDILSEPRWVLVVEPLMGVAGVLLGLSSVLFVHGTFGVRRPPAVTGALLATFTGLSVWSLLNARAAVTWVFLAMLAGSLEAARTVALAALRGKPGARLVGGGMLAMGLGFGVGLLSNLGVDMSFLGPRRVVSVLLPFSSVLVLLVLSSLHLARRVAAIQRELAQRVVEVTRLSEEKLEKEREARREELARKLLEAEYERKLRELEEARQLQVSLLPSRPPDVPGLAMAARMTTASEVGGDYYDFDVAEDGSLTIAIGDATGHGMRAGTLVAATKGLFGVLSREPELTGSMRRAGAALHRMNLRALTMALTLVRIEGRTVRIAAAGMPPALVHRAATGELESLLVPGMPLGARAGFPYAQVVTHLEPGDTLLLMSDGLPERLDPLDEMLDYERTAALFREAAGRGVTDLVDQLFASADAFAKGRPPEDDVTVIALRRVS